jgi:phage terminase large subunit-like protein
MYVSVDPTLARRDALRCKDLIESDWYQARFCDRVQIVSSENKAKGAQEYYTTAGGMRFATSIESKGMGWHVHTQVCDDPIKSQEATPTTCARARFVWSNTYASRRASPKQLFARVIVQQRLAPFDLIGLATEEGYDVLTLPLEADPSRYSLPESDLRSLRRTSLWDGKTGGDRRTVPGELLCEGLMGKEDLPGIKKDFGQAHEAQNNQDPTQSESKVYDTTTLRRQLWAKLPPGGRYTWDWDLKFKSKDQAKSKKKGSYAVGWLWYETRTASYLVQELRGQWGFSETKAAISRGLKTAKGPVYIEDKANGPAIQDELKISTPGICMVEPMGSKVDRALAIQEYLSTVYFPRAPVSDLIFAELDRFPGEPNDRGDVLSQHLARRWLDPMSKYRESLSGLSRKGRGRGVR